MKITTEQKQKVNKIAKKYGLKLVLLFGSHASGKTHKKSDLDIAVLGNRAIDFKKQISLINELSGIFGKEIDLSVINIANPLLLFQISKSSLIIYGDKRDYFKFKLNAFHRYNDYLYFIKKLEGTLHKKLVLSL
jgi:uncharacterized protein